MTTQRKTSVAIEDFGGGIDLREGITNRSTSKVFDLLNYQITPGRKLSRRLPCQELPGTLADENCFLIDGKITAFIARGSSFGTFSVTGLAVDTKVIYYDLPPFNSAAGVVIDAGSISGVAVAVIKHIDDNDAASIYMHVFDEATSATRTHFTYISDGASPAYWTPQLPQHPYGVDNPGAASTAYTPCMAVDGGRVIISQPNGDCAYSAVGRPRVFNERTALQLLQDGRWWYILNAVAGSNEAYVDTPNEVDFLTTTAEYGLEALNPLGTWVEVAATITTDLSVFYRTKLIFDGGAYAGRPFRFYARAKPQATIVEGCRLTDTGSIIAGVISYKGASVIFPGTAPTDLVGFSGVLVYYSFNPTTFAVSVTSLKPHNGNVIVARCYVGEDGKPNTILPVNGYADVGGVDIRVGSLDMDANMLVGTTILIGAEQRRVVAAARRDGYIKTITVDLAFATVHTDATLSYNPTYIYDCDIGDTGTPTYALRSVEAVLLAGDKDAGVFTSSQYSPEGTVPLAVAITQNRAFVQYSHAVQMWAISPFDQPSFLSKQEIGVGTGVDHPKLQVVDDGVLIPTIFGPRMFFPTGNAKDYIQYAAYGDMLHGIDLPKFQAAAWWQEQSVYVTAGTSDDDTTIWVLSYNRQSRLAAWGRWILPNITKIDKMFVAAGTLMVLAQGKVTQFVTLPERYQDRDEFGVWNTYQSTVRGLYTDFGHLRDNKRFTRMDISQVGTSKVNLYVSPADVTDSAMPTDAPVASGYTQGLTKVALAVVAPSLSYEVTSEDNDGHELNSLAFDYVLRHR